MPYGSLYPCWRSFKICKPPIQCRMALSIKNCKPPRFKWMLMTHSIYVDGLSKMVNLIIRLLSETMNKQISITAHSMPRGCGPVLKNGKTYVSSRFDGSWVKDVLEALHEYVCVLKRESWCTWHADCLLVDVDWGYQHATRNWLCRQELITGSLPDHYRNSQLLP